MIHKQKRAWIEGVPVGWPEGWAFGPGCPLPPGWEGKEFRNVVLGKVVVPSHAPLVEVFCLDQYAEDTDALLGQILVLRCYDHGRTIRMKLSRNVGMPWTEQLMLPIREYEPGVWGLMENIEIDRARAHGDTLKLMGYVWGSQPIVDMEAEF